MWTIRPIVLLTIAFLAGNFSMPGAHAETNATKNKPAQNTGNETMADPDRYALKALDDGTVARVDKQTGAMSLCTVTGGTMICRLAADERDAYEREIENLRKQLSAQKADPFRSGESDAEKRPETQEESEFNKALEFSEKAMRRFFGVIQDLRKEYGTAE